MYVIVLSHTGEYVTKPGMERSYTTRLEDAVVFTNAKDAERNRCGNEHIASVDFLLKGKQ